MTKTFREVIADIKEGEVWVYSGNVFATNTPKIRMEKGNIRISHEDKINDYNFKVDMLYELEGAQYTFTEAFAEYERGFEIESLVTGDKFKYDVETGVSYSNDGDGWFSYSDFEVEEIRGKWYISR